MSMMLSERQGNADWTIQPSTPSTWIPDERVQRCFGCGASFSTFRRKHHCRSCGRIFCASCTAYRELIPSYYHTFSGVHPNKPQRTCAPCAQSLKRAAEVEHLIRMISVLPVLMSELFELRLVNKRWNHATNTMFSLFRGLQYKLSCQAYSNIECDFLQTHSKEFYGHVPWQVHALAALHQRGDVAFKKESTYFEVSCRKLLCARTCRPMLSVEDILRLGMTNSLEESPVQRWVIEAWRSTDHTAMRHMMPWWVYFGCKFKTLFKHGLIPMASKHLDLLFALWFECDMQKTPQCLYMLEQVQKGLMSDADVETRREMRKTQHLVQCLKEMATAPTKESRAELISSFFKNNARVRLPWNVNVVIKRMRVVKQLKSSSKPLLLELFAVDGESHSVLLKREDVRTDRLAMVIGYWMNHLTHNTYVHTYDVFPLNERCGIVQMIPRTKTLYDIRKSKVTLLNHIMNSNETLSVKTLRERVVASTAGACLLAFTMGLGDRHLENILVSADALLIHVDFGYVLGEDPKRQRTQMRITEDMIDALGGKHSETFASFVETTQASYAAMRIHASFWYHLLVSECFISGDKRRHWKRIRDHTLDRFVPGEGNEEASIQFESVVASAAQETWMQTFMDMTHSASNTMSGMFRMEL